MFIKVGHKTQARANLKPEQASGSDRTNSECAHCNNPYTVDLPKKEYLDTSTKCCLNCLQNSRARYLLAVTSKHWVDHLYPIRDPRWNHVAGPTHTKKQRLHLLKCLLYTLQTYALKVQMKFPNFTGKYAELWSFSYCKPQLAQRKCWPNQKIVLVNKCKMKKQ